MDHEDPVSQFFPDEENVDLYSVLSLKSDAKPEDIRKSYRKLALLCHPDKHATASDAAKAEAHTKFQQIGFAYAVLSDEKRKQRYDKTGRTDEGLAVEADEDGGWEAYFEDLFDHVTRGKLDEMKKEYQGSAEEIEDLKAAYNETNGLIGDIMNHIPHSTIDDEPRFIVVLSDLISKGELPFLSEWESSVKDEKARLVRKKQGDKEANEAEELAKELGVWDEFYGSGKTGERRGKGGRGKGPKGNRAAAEDDEDHSVLKALIMKKKKNMDGFFDSFAAKYAEPHPKGGKGKKRKAEEEDAEEDVDSSPKKKANQNTGVVSPPDIDDEEFEKLQQRLFGEKATSTASSRTSASKGKRPGKSRKAK